MMYLIIALTQHNNNKTLRASLTVQTDREDTALAILKDQAVRCLDVITDVSFYNVYRIEDSGKIEGPIETWTTEQLKDSVAVRH